VYILPNGTVKRGKWVNGIKQGWTELTPEEAAPYQHKLQEAVTKAEGISSV
jgi:hypothetical protein